MGGRLLLFAGALSAGVKGNGRNSPSIGDGDGIAVVRERGRASLAGLLGVCARRRAGGKQMDFFKAGIPRKEMAILDQMLTRYRVTGFGILTAAVSQIM